MAGSWWRRSPTEALALGALLSPRRPLLAGRDLRVALSSFEPPCARLGNRCPPLVCTAGYPSDAVRVLLAGLREAATQLRHHGDDDAAGEQILGDLRRRMAPGGGTDRCRLPSGSTAVPPALVNGRERRPASRRPAVCGSRPTGKGGRT